MGSGNRGSTLTLVQLPSKKDGPRAASHTDLAGRGQRPFSLRLRGPRGGVAAPDSRARPPARQISFRRGAPRTSAWDPATASGRRLGYTPSRGPGRRSPDAPRGSDSPSWTIYPARALPVRRCREGGRAGSPRPRGAAPRPCPSALGPAAARAPVRPSPGGPRLRALTRSRPRRCGPRALPGPASSLRAVSLRRRPPHLRRDPSRASSAARPAAPRGLCPARALAVPPPSAPAGALRLPLRAPLTAPAAPPRSPPPAPPPRGSLPTRAPARGPQALPPSSPRRLPLAPYSPRCTCGRAGGLSPQWAGGRWATPRDPGRKPGVSPRSLSLPPPPM